MSPRSRTVRLQVPVRRSELGAASLLIPFIVTIIFMFVAFALFWTSNQDIARWQQAEADAKVQLADMTKDRDELIAAQDALSEVLGYRDEAVLGSQSDAQAIAADLEAVRGMTSVGDSDVTVEKIVAGLRATVQNTRAAVATAESDLAAAQSARQAAEAASSTLEGNYQQQLAQLNQQLQDDAATASAAEQQLQSRIDQLLASERTTANSLTTAQQDLGDLQVDLDRTRSNADATIKALGTKRVDAEPEAPDGAILAVGRDGGTAFIDLGGRDDLRRGTRFEVLRRGQGGTLRSVGRVEVQEVDSAMALVGVLGTPDPYDPILPGDLIRNPHFTKGQETRFYLIGDFPLSMSREFIGQRLDELGARLDDSLGVSTDVVVLGHESLTNDEFAQPLTETDEYVLAEKLGLRLMRLDELAQYLRY